MFNIEKYKEIQEFLIKNKKKTKIVSISKNHPQKSVLEAIKFGVTIFGENRVNEAKNKFDNIIKNYPNIELHLTGPLQSNKVKDALSIFHTFHTLDREKIAQEFAKNINLLGNKKIFIQVNTGKEDSKSGIYPENLNDFKNFCLNDLKLNIVGLMCIPPILEDPSNHFKTLQQLAIKNNLKELSIGMSGDYLSALEFNPTYIRLGTTLFGQRKWK